MGRAKAGGGRSALPPLLVLLLLAIVSKPVSGFNNAPPRSFTTKRPLRMQAEQDATSVDGEVSRAGALLGQTGSALAALGALGGLAAVPSSATAAAPKQQQEKLEYMPGIEGRGYGKPRQVRSLLKEMGSEGRNG